MDSCCKAGNPQLVTVLASKKATQVQARGELIGQHEQKLKYDNVAARYFTDTSFSF